MRYDGGAEDSRIYDVHQPIHAKADTTDQEILERSQKLAYNIGIACAPLFAYVMKLERRIALLEGANRNDS